MAKRSVDLPEALDRFVMSRVESGRFSDANEVMRAALRLLEREEQVHEEKLALVRAAIAAGDAGEDAEERVFDRLYAYIDELSGKRSENVV